MPSAPRLNTFQRAMLVWEEATPYNAAHVLRLRSAADPPRLEAAIRSASAAAGIERLAIDRRGWRFHYEPGGEVPVRRIDAAGRPAGEALREAVEEDMNRPFTDEPCHPIRWGVLDDPATGTHSLSVVYRHVAADGPSIRRLIGNVLAALDGSSLVPIHTGDTGARDPSRLFSHLRRPLGGARSLIREVRLYARLRRAHRRRERPGAGQRSSFRMFEPGSGFLDRLVAASRARGFGLGAVFAAALTSAIAERTPQRRAHRTRRSLAIGLVTDLRRESREDLSSAFGLHVGRSVLVVEDPDIPFGRLLPRIAGWVRREKEARTFAEPEWSLAALSALRRLFPGTRSRRWYRKVYPISAGLTNVKWDGGSLGEAGGRVLAYARVAPLGPAIPLVIAPTTFGRLFNFTLSFGEASLDGAEAEDLGAGFLEKMEAFSAGRI